MFRRRPPREIPRLGIPKLDQLTQRQNNIVARDRQPALGTQLIRVLSNLHNVLIVIAKRIENNRSYQLRACHSGYWLLATGYWLLATGYFLPTSSNSPE